jgi:hypothetical protein
MRLIRFYYTCSSNAFFPFFCAQVDEVAAAPTKMSKEDEASENKFRALEKEFRKKVGLDKDD